MPPEKKISQYRIYKCQWQIGDVFAYRFDGQYSQEKGFHGQYILFRKVDEGIWHPGHIVPLVHVYMWVGDVLPDINIIRNLKCLPQFYLPEKYKDLQNELVLYRLKMLNTSKKVIPTNKLFYLGNLKDVEMPKNDLLKGYPCFWNEFEEYIISRYLAWTDIDF